MAYKPLQSAAQLTLIAALTLSMTVGAPALVYAEERTTSQEETSQEAKKQLPITISVVAADGEVPTAWGEPVSLSVEEGTNAWDATKEAFAQLGLTYNGYESAYGYFLDSVTQGETTKKTAEDYSTSWQFLVNDVYASVGASGYTLQAGDKIEWRFGSYNAATTPATTDNEALSLEPETVEADHESFDQNTTEAEIPTSNEEAWRASVTSNGAPVSEVLLVGDFVYVAVGSSSVPGSTQTPELLKINRTTGEVEGRASLAGTISYTCRPSYEDGVIVVPLDGGRVQAINATTLKTRWVSAAPTTGGQASTTTNIYDDVVFSGTAVYDSNWNITAGTLSALSFSNGTTLSELSLTGESAGFYWTGVAQLRSNVYVTGDTAGNVIVFTKNVAPYASSATVLSKTSLGGSALNADLAVKDGYVIAVTRDGVVHKLAVDDQGQVSEVASVKALGGSKAAPTLVGNKIVVGGTSLAGDTAAVAVVNFDSMTVENTITSADGEPLSTTMDGVAAPVVVSTANGKTICAFTVNIASPDATYTSYSAGGNAYWFELGESEAHALYTPDGSVAQYCDSPVVVAKDGSLYYLNDSGTIVKLVAKTTAPVKPTTPTEQNQTDNTATVEPQSANSSQGVAKQTTEAATASQGAQSTQATEASTQTAPSSSPLPQTGDASSLFNGLLAVCGGVLTGGSFALRRKKVK